MSPRGGIRKPDLDRNCLYCSAPIIRRRAASGQLESYSCYLTRKYCSPSCARKKLPAHLKFWTYAVEADNDCWEWQGTKTTRGYGLFFLDGGKVLAHRFSYELMIAPIPDGLTIDHLCRNKACVNPYHLDPVPSVVNMMRGDAVPAINARKIRCIRGHLFTVENTRYVEGVGRFCRACGREHAARYRAQRKAAK